MSNMQAAWTVLFAGMAVVFVLLVVLIRMVRKYGSAGPAAPAAEIVPQRAAAQPAPAVEAGIPGEVVAAIAAAVACLYGEDPGSIVSVRRAGPAGRSAWAMAGLLENTRPF